MWSVERGLSAIVRRWRGIAGRVSVLYEEADAIRCYMLGTVDCECVGT